MNDEFLTARELGIENWEHIHLVKVLFFLETIKPDRVKNPITRKFYHIETAIETMAKFSMADTCNNFDCGTALCIGGYVKASALGYKLQNTIKLNRDDKRKIDIYVKEYSPDYNSGNILTRLYYPTDINQNDWEKITSIRAAFVLRKFLTTGKISSNWS